MKYYSADQTKRMIWPVHVAHMAVMRVHAGFWWGDLRERDHLEDVGLDCRIILKMNLQEVGLGAWTELMLLRIMTVGGLL